MGRLADRLGTSEGHAYTLCLGLLLAIGLLVTGVPPVLRDDVRLAAAPFAAPPTIGTEFDTGAAPAFAADSVPAVFLIVPALPPALSQSTTPTGTTTTTLPRPTGGGPLAVVIGRWTSAPETAPAGHRTVPEGGLPVGSSVGFDDTRSYVLLRGTGTTLSLALSAEPGAQQLPEVATVRACLITESPWSVTDGAPHDAGPAYDTARCVLGAAADGRWTFDLARFSLAERVGPAGFALVPATNQLPFQVVFEL